MAQNLGDNGLPVTAPQTSSNNLSKKAQDIFKKSLNISNEKPTEKRKRKSKSISIVPSGRNVKKKPRHEIQSIAYSYTSFGKQKGTIIDKNLSNDNGDALKTIKFLQCAYCYDYSCIKTYKGVEKHIESCSAFIERSKEHPMCSMTWINQKNWQFADVSDIPLFRWTYQQNLYKGRDFSTTFFECSLCGFERFQTQPHLKNKAFENLLKHQKDEHNIEYSTEFLSRTESENESSESDTEGESSRRNNEYFSKLRKLAEDRTNKIENLTCYEEMLEIEVTSTKKALEESKAESEVELEKVKNQLKTEVASKISEIQTLEIEKNTLETEVTSAKKALEESKVESKVELEKVKNQLQTEVASKKPLEESLAKYQKLQQILATKIFQANPSNENLISLLSLEVEKLFEKYEEIMKFNDSNIAKVEGEIDDTMKDKKLNLQILQRELYEKELDGIMDVLKIPSEDRNYTNILPMIKNLLEQVDTEHYTNAVENLMS